MPRTIQQLREARGESRLQLAEALDVSISEITDWELGRAEPSCSRLHALVAHFGIAEHELRLLRPLLSSSGTWR
jgi:transcriptional regulator with XRE-family HTH domain